MYSGIMAKYRLRSIYMCVIACFAVIMACAVAIIQEGSFLETYILSGLVGATLSLIGAVDWPLFSLLIPVGKEATYRGVYAFVRNIVGFIGPGLYTLIVQETNNHSLGFAQVVFWNVLLLLSLYWLDVDKAMRDNGTYHRSESAALAAASTRNISSVHNKIAPVDEESPVLN